VKVIIPFFISEASENGGGPLAGPPPTVKVSFSRSLIEGSCESGLEAAINPTKQHIVQDRKQMRLDIVVASKARTGAARSFSALSDIRTSLHYNLQNF
jgi:hypothetical protein